MMIESKLVQGTRCKDLFNFLVCLNIILGVMRRKLNNYKIIKMTGLERTMIN